MRLKPPRGNRRPYPKNYKRFPLGAICRDMDDLLRNEKCFIFFGNVTQSSVTTTSFPHLFCDCLRLNMLMPRSLLRTCVGPGVVPTFLC